MHGPYCDKPQGRSAIPSTGAHGVALLSSWSLHRVLLIASTTGYQIRSFADAADRLGIEIVLGTDRCHVLENPWADHALPIRFEDPAESFAKIAARGPFRAVLAVGDQPALAAAHIARHLGLRFSAPEAVAAAKDKFLARRKLGEANLLVPQFELLDPQNPKTRSRTFPCVLKPVTLSASRGVIRANDRAEFEAALLRIRKILETEENRDIQVESFIPGREFALEGVVTRGRLHPLALFDKPDPLDGPFFEETIYLTPSREPPAIQHAILDTARRAVAALGLTDGPVHAEMRVNDGGVWMLEIAARPIGGLCSRVLRFHPDASLEEILLRHALDEDVSAARMAPGAHGVMMIPIASGGVYEGVDGIESARAVAAIEDVVITAKPGQLLLPLPEGASYLGFIFARAASAELADQALRQAHSRLRFHFAASLPVVR